MGISRSLYPLDAALKRDGIGPLPGPPSRTAPSVSKLVAVVCSMVPYRAPLGWCVLLRSAPVIESRLEYAAVRPVAIPVVFLSLAGSPFGGDVTWRWSVKRSFEQLSWVEAVVSIQLQAL